MTLAARSWKRLETLGIWGFADQAALSLTGLLIAVFVARTGGPVELGIYTIVQSGVLLVAGLVKAGFGDPIVLRSGRKQAATPPGVGSILIAGHVLLGLILASSLLLIHPNSLSIKIDSPVNFLLVMLLPIAGFFEIARSMRLAIWGERGLFVGDVAVSIARLIALVFIAAGLSGAELGFWSLVAGGLISITTIMPYLTRTIRFGELAELWNMGKWFMTESLLHSLGENGIWFVIIPAAGVALGGEIRGAQQLFAPVQLLTAGLTPLLLRRLALKEGRIGQEARSLSIAQITLSVAWASTIVLIGPQLVSVLLGKDFQLSQLELALMGIAAVLASIYSIGAVLLRARGLGSRLIAARLAAISVTLGLLILFSSSLTELAMALIAGQTAGAVLAWLPHFRRTRHGLSSD